ncbi:MAG: nitroreductase family protein, partial [Dehalococcoidia bacterium]
RFIVVKDTQNRRKIAESYHTAWKTGQDNPQTQAVLKTRDPSIVSHATQFANEGIYQVPVFIFVCATQSDAADSVLQAVQNLMLAARGLGLGTVFTTLLRRHDAEIRELLSVPEGSEVVCMIPLGYPESKFGPTRRMPVEEVAFAERWGTPLR